jgi:hypothetical protein
LTVELLAFEKCDLDGEVNRIIRKRMKRKLNFEMQISQKRLYNPDTLLGVELAQKQIVNKYINLPQVLPTFLTKDFLKTYE